MIFRTNRLTIRSLLLDDLNNIHHLLSLPETDKYNTFGIPNSIEETHHTLLNWLSFLNENPINKYVFIIENIETNFIGLAGINIGKPKYYNAEIWFKLHKDFWSKGYATEMCFGILNFCFNDLKLHRVEAGCAIDNLASKKVLEKIGMQYEGCSRKNLPIRGNWVDGLRYAILDQDYFQKNVS